MNILVTGAAGFIGMHVCQRLLVEGHRVVGVDNLNDYYDINLKKNRINHLQDLAAQFRFVKVDIADKTALFKAMEHETIHVVINLAAQAGVRYSLENPDVYAHSNLVGFLNVLELCRYLKKSEHHIALIYASTSSVYGKNQTMPFSETHYADHPMSFYAATKKANELMAHSYSHLYNIPTTGLRFFTVYGPWGRPDMALFKFTKAILMGEAIPLFNGGDMVRDFTYIDDIVDGIVPLIYKSATPSPAFNPHHPDPSISDAPYRIFNIGRQEPLPLMRYIEALEHALGCRAKKELLPMQDGDVAATHADTRRLNEWIGYAPKVSVEEGVQQFVAWYRGYYNI